MKRTLFTTIAVLLCCGHLMGQQEMAKVSYFGHLYLETSVNGHPARLAFDTGAPYTCIDSTYLADSKLQYKNIGRARMGGSGNGQETVPIIINELTYIVADTEYTSKVSPVIQLKSILGDQADGLLGIDNMGGKVIAINYVDELMGFWNQLGDTTGYTSIPIRYENRRIYVPLSITIRDGNTVEGEALIDLGSGGSVTLTSAVASQHGVKEVLPQMHYSYFTGGIGGAASGSDFRAKSASVGGFTLNDITMDYSDNTEGALSNMEYIAIVGNDFWERFDMIINLQGNRLYLKPNIRFAEPFKSPVHGFSYTDRSHTLGCWIVNCLYKDSNAEKAGLRNGDRISKINGRDVSDITLEEQKHLLDNIDSVSLTVQRGSTTVEIAFPFDNPKI
jgi:hypothetical protein